MSYLRLANDLRPYQKVPQVKTMMKALLFWLTIDRGGQRARRGWRQWAAAGKATCAPWFVLFPDGSHTIAPTDQV